MKFLLNILLTFTSIFCFSQNIENMNALDLFEIKQIINVDPDLVTVQTARFNEFDTKCNNIRK